MRVLIVASHNKGRFAPFIVDQVEALKKLCVECEYFGIEGKGIFGYFSELGRLKREIAEYNPSVIHAHYGLSGLLANLQRKVPVVTTYHGSDINSPGVLPFSKMSIRLSAFNIFVSQKNIDKSRVKKKYALIPCGVDLEVFRQIPRAEARKILGWGDSDKIVLFAGAFDNPVKNAPLAKQVVAMLDGVKLMELKGYSREEVALRMNAANALLMTSFSEGSPQVIKEAMACCCPIVSVDVGDVSELVEDVDGCFIVPQDARELASALKVIISKSARTDGRRVIISKRLSSGDVASRILRVYESLNCRNFGSCY